MVKFNDTAATQTSPLSLHDALPIFSSAHSYHVCTMAGWRRFATSIGGTWAPASCQTSAVQSAHQYDASGTPHLRHRSEEHTSELQSRRDLVCRLLLEKKNKIYFWLS